MEHEQSSLAEGFRYVVIGGPGSMGRITVRDLYETCSARDEIVIADFDLARAEELAGKYQSKKNKPKVYAIYVDVKNHVATAKALGGAFAVINSTQYQLNIDVMQAALLAQKHYIDLGGLFHITRKQLELSKQFQSINRTAILGMGAAPGITNILSRYAADRLDTVTEIHTRVASLDKTTYVPKPALSVSYTLRTILEEFSFKPAVFTKGEFQFAEPMSGDKPHRFPPPIGVRHPMYTIHSEVATLPLSFRNKGVQEVSFKIAFDPEFVDRVRFLRDLGFSSHEPIKIAGNNAGLAPIDVVNLVAMSQPPSKQVGPLKQYEIVRAVVKGKSKGKKVTWVVDCHTAGMPEWDIGLDIDTGSPPAIAAQMLALGEITRTGAIPAEIAIKPELFFKHLKKRKMKIKAVKKAGWSLPT